MKKLFLLMTVAAIACGGVQAQEARKKGFSYPPSFEGAKVETYKKVGDTELKLWIFSPTNDAKARPAIVFFFGGGWTSGSPSQFERQCRHLAARGMVAITADYRVRSRQQAKPAQCVADAKSCIRWVRANAERLGIDPKRIAAGGGSAGGHLAGATGTLPGLDEPGEDAKVSSVPDALVLFNPALMLAPFDGVDAKGFGTGVGAEKLGCEPQAISPIHHVKKGTPPTIIFHGKADTTVPYSTAEGFAAQMKKLGNRCELVGYDDQPHGFFNSTKYEETLAAADAFLVSLGWLAPATK